MGQYRLSRKAAEDLDRIWDYTVKEWSEEQAITYYRQIHQTVISLSSHTNISGRPYEHIREGLLGYHVNRHIIFYRKATDGTILVSRILHEKMDFRRHL